MWTLLDDSCYFIVNSIPYSLHCHTTTVLGIIKEYHLHSLLPLGLGAQPFLLNSLLRHKATLTKNCLSSGG